MAKTTGIEPKPALTVLEVQAVRDCIAGKATSQQAQIAIDWIMKEAARVTDLSYVPGEFPLETAFREGRRYAGILVRYMLEPATLVEAKRQDKEREAKPQ